MPLTIFRSYQNRKVTHVVQTVTLNRTSTGARTSFLSLDFSRRAKNGTRETATALAFPVQFYTFATTVENS